MRKRRSSLNRRSKASGAAYGEIGAILWKNPFRVVEPDAAFVKATSLPVKASVEGYLETIPELVVEIRSKNDTKPYIERKVADYLAAGVVLVWAIDPKELAVVEHRQGVPQKVYKISKTLVCEDIIPDFRLPLNNLFRA